MATGTLEHRDTVALEVAQAVLDEFYEVMAEWKALPDGLKAPIHWCQPGIHDAHRVIAQHAAHYRQEPSCDSSTCVLK